MNLHYETVSPLLKETLQKLVNSPIFKDNNNRWNLFEPTTRTSKIY